MNLSVKVEITFNSSGVSINKATLKAIIPTIGTAFFMISKVEYVSDADRSSTIITSNRGSNSYHPNWYED